ncbi:MAG: RNA methyltransferase [Lachnospiraceae bacterium]|nr:RNA methyltransferase [Lachnospiraceae bacterium]
MITSAGNPKLRLIRELLDRSRTRRQEGAFIIEGIRSFEEAPKDQILAVFVSESFRKRYPEIEGEVVKEEIFQKLSDVRTPQGIMAAVKIKRYSLDDILRPGMKGSRLYLVLEGIQDPGNVGTMIRTAEGAGVAGIIMDRGTADAYAPKVVRSTMGSIFRVPFLYTDDLSFVLSRMKQCGVYVYAAEMGGEEEFGQTEYQEKAAFLIGNEGNGLSSESLKKADKQISIPMMGRVKSLNAAISSALFLYDYRRQWKNAK